MKKILFLALFCIIMGFKTQKITTECEIKQFYKGIETDDDTKVLTNSGNLEDAEVVLIPTKMDEGKFKVTLTKKASNLYKIDDTKFYIETRYCYEYATRQEVIIIVESNYGYTKGKVIF
jgi:hypothetical protein